MIQYITTSYKDTLHETVKQAPEYQCQPQNQASQQHQQDVIAEVIHKCSQPSPFRLAFAAWFAGLGWRGGFLFGVGRSCQFGFSCHSLGQRLKRCLQEAQKYWVSQPSHKRCHQVGRVLWAQESQRGQVVTFGLGIQCVHCISQDRGVYEK